LNRSWLGRRAYELKVFLKGLFFWAVVIGSIFLAVRIFFPKVEYSIVEKEIVIDNLSEKINQLKGELIDTLKKAESMGSKDCSSLIVFDPNPTNKKVEVASLGCFQFKSSTVIYYHKKLYGKEITRKDAILLALDENKSAQLASDIIFTEKGSLKNWYNSSKKYDLYSKLEIINELQK
jgi:hypothetical protein